MLKREIAIIAHIQHPNLVRFIAAVLNEAVERGGDAPIIISELWTWISEMLMQGSTDRWIAEIVWQMDLKPLRYHHTNKQFSYIGEQVPYHFQLIHASFSQSISLKGAQYSNAQGNEIAH